MSDVSCALLFLASVVAGGIFGFLISASVGHRRGHAVGRTEACREIGVARKIYGDRLKDAAHQLRYTAENLWPESWNDEPPDDSQPTEPRGYD